MRKDIIIKITNVHFVRRFENMAYTSSSLEQGYEELLRYCSNEIRHFGREFQLEVSNGLREAVVRLQRRPELENKEHDDEAKMMNSPCFC